MARSKIVSSAPDHLRIQLLQMEILPASILFTTQQWLIEKKYYAVADTGYVHIKAVYHHNEKMN